MSNSSLNDHTTDKGQFESAVPPWRSTPSNDASVNSPPDALDFFISYAAEDLERTQWIARSLQAAGYKVSYQHRDFETGGRYQRDIDQRLGHADAVIAVISEASLDRDWCRKEWEAAGDRLLPIRVEPVSVTGLLGNRTYTDLFGPGMAAEENRRETLLRAAEGQQTSVLDLKTVDVTIELPPRCKQFVGHEILLDRIYAHFFGSQAPGPRRLTLAGVGGTGKTALAVEYGHRMREHKRYQNTWYITAESEVTLIAGLSALVAELQLPKQSGALSIQLSNGLARMEGWLLIIDDAPDLESVIEYLPSPGTGHILITSENPSTWGRADVLHVTGWDPEVAVEFLLKETGSTDTQVAERLVSELEAHPERLLQAVSYIDRTQTSIKQYLNIYRERVSQQHDKFAATLALALERLTSNPLAMDLLRFGSFLGPERVPTDLLVEGLQLLGYTPDDAAINKAAEPLIQFSLAQRDDVSIKFSRLVQAQVRTSAVERGETAKWLETAVVAVDHLFPPISKLDDPAVWRRAGLLLPHALVAVNAARAAELAMPKVGRLLCRAAHYIGGGATFQGRSGSTHRQMIADIKRAPEGPSAMSAALLEESREILQASESDALDRSEVLAEIGEFHRTEERFEKAIEIFAEAYDLAKQSENAPKEVVAMRLAELARTERDAGMISQACSRLEEARDMCVQAGTPGRGNLATILDGLGIARSRQGRYPEAIVAFGEALVIEEEVFGTNYVEVSITLDSLSEAFTGYGDYRAMRESADRMIRIERSIYGEASAARCAGLLSAAWYAIDAGDAARALALGSEIVELVGDTVITHDSTKSVGYLVQSIADRMLDRKNWRMLVEMSRQALNDANLATVDPMLNLARFLTEDGELSEAIELAERLKQDLIRENNWRSATDAALAEAEARTEAGDMEQAESSLRMFTEVLKCAERVDDSLAATLELERGRILSAAGQTDESLAAFTDSYSFSGRQGLVLKQADACVEKGQLLIEDGKLEDGIEVLREGLEIRSQNLMKGNPSVTEAQLVIARAEGMRGDEVEARRILDAAVAATAEAKGARSVEVGRLYVEVSGVLATMSRMSEAASRAEEGYRILCSAVDSREDEIGAACDVALRMQEIGKLERAHELAAIAYNLARDVNHVSLLSRLRANEIMARVALSENDTKTAEKIADELQLMLKADVPPRLKVATWLIVANIARDPHERLEALEQALSLNLDALSTPRRMIVLHTAEANWQLDKNRRAIDLLEPTLNQYSDDYRLQALDVLVRAAIDDKDELKAREFITRASALVDKEPDSLQRMYQRIWIAEALRRLESEEDAIVTVNSIANALNDLDEEVQTREAARIAPLYRRLAGFYAELEMVNAQVDALEHAAQLYRIIDQPDELAQVLYERARADIDTGRPDASKETLDRLMKQLQRLGKDASAVAVRVNVGVMYIDLGDGKQARDTLEQALAQWDDLNDRDTPSHTLLLVPLARACLMLDDLLSAEEHVERAVSCSQLEGAEQYLDLLDVLFDIALRRVDENEAFERIVKGIRLVADLWLLPSYAAAARSRVARMRAEEVGWDDLAFSLISEADERLAKIEDRPDDVVVEIATVKAEALRARDLIRDGVRRLSDAVETVRSNDNHNALMNALARLGDFQLIAGDPAAAAVSYHEAVEFQESLSDSFAGSLILRVAEANAFLAAGARSEGIRVFRQAMKDAVSEDIPEDQITLKALSGLVLSLALDARDSVRAGIVLERAEALNELLLDREPPDPKSFPQFVLAMYRVRGALSAMEVVKAALQCYPDAEGVLVALFEVVAQADMVAEKTLDLIAESGDCESIMTTGIMLARAFASREAFDDAKAVLRRGIELLGLKSNNNKAVAEVELLLTLSQLDTSSDRAEARQVLHRAVELAQAHDELKGSVSYLQTTLGSAYGEAELWKQAVDVLLQVEEKGETAWRYLSIGRAMIGEYALAIDGLNRLTVANPDPQLLYALAIVEKWSGQKQAALDTLAEVLESGELLSDALVICAQVCNDIAEYAKAAEYAAAAQRIDPENISAYSSQAWALQYLGLDAAASCEAAFDKVVALSSGGSEYSYALEGRASARRLLGGMEGARADYEEVLERIEANPYHWLEAWVRYCLGQYDAADAAYQKAMEEDPDSVSTRFDSALCRVVAGKPEALDQYRSILEDLDEREAQSRLAPLRVAQTDLRIAGTVNESLQTNPLFREVVAAIDASVKQTEALVVQPIFPRIPDRLDAVGLDETHSVGAAV